MREIERDENQERERVAEKRGSDGSVGCNPPNLGARTGGLVNPGV